MSMAGSAGGRFEGSYLGDASRLPADAVLECKICWHVYDPSVGCETWQIPPGTAFRDLPDHWRCPVCDGAREQFMVVSALAPQGGTGASAAAVNPSKVEELLAQAARAWPARMEALFKEIHSGQMRGLPFLNEALAVKAVGFRPYEGLLLGVLITPWFMNLILAPGPDQDWSDLPSGGKERISFPSGVYEFTYVNRAQDNRGKTGLDLAPYKACSLFSPMAEFSTMAQAVETAEAVLTVLFDASLCPPQREATRPQGVTEQEGEAQSRPEDPDRRSLLFGRPQKPMEDPE